jgi:hypothetical protein
VSELPVSQPVNGALKIRIANAAHALARFPAFALVLKDRLLPTKLLDPALG